MKSRVQRWDLAIGGFASLNAMGGFVFSSVQGNTTAVVFGSASTKAQYFMAFLTGMFLVVIAINTGIRFDDRPLPHCKRSLKRCQRKTDDAGRRQS